jgi:hypothetical protein
MSKPPVANFDSATGMVRALAAYLDGRDFPMLGSIPLWAEPAMRMVGGLVNSLPVALREEVYTWSGWAEAIGPARLRAADAEQVAASMTALYPMRTYPAVALGSSNGAAVHLFAALGMPWLPQTFLMPVARPMRDPDDPKADMEWGREPGALFLERNPHTQLHQMHDPNQDRLMVRQMAYFRVKRLRLGPAYERFLLRALEPGGLILIVECGLSWPTTRLGPRHLFQFGGLGGATVTDYHCGGQRVADYLARYKSRHARWDAPIPDGESPEAEWGFEETLREDIERLARRHGWRVMRMRFDRPEDLSPVVADFYRQWYRERGLDGQRLLVESFVLQDPYWTLRTASVPFWMVFNKEPSARALAAYLDRADPFDEIAMMLFSHGVESVGLVRIEQWRALLDRARRRGLFIGVDERAFPRDFAVFTRYHHDLLAKIKERHPLPAPLPLSILEDLRMPDGHRLCSESSEPERSATAPSR